MSVFIADDYWDDNGDPVTFWSRRDTKETVMVEYGDGSHIISMFVEIE